MSDELKSFKLKHIFYYGWWHKKNGFGLKLLSKYFNIHIHQCSPCDESLNQNGDILHYFKVFNDFSDLQHYNPEEVLVFLPQRTDSAIDDKYTVIYGPHVELDDIIKIPIE